MTPFCRQRRRYHDAQKKNRPYRRFDSSGAGDGNRTRVRSLEGSGSTIELHPQLQQSVLYPIDAIKCAEETDSPRLGETHALLLVSREHLARSHLPELGENAYISRISKQISVDSVSFCAMCKQKMQRRWRRCQCWYWRRCQCWRRRRRQISSPQETDFCHTSLACRQDDERRCA